MNTDNPVGIAIVGCGRVLNLCAKSMLTHPEHLRIIGVYDIIVFCKVKMTPLRAKL